MTTTVLMLALAWWGLNTFGPDLPPDVAVDQTYVIAPKTADGAPDYEAFHAERRELEIAGKTNGAAAFWMAFGHAWQDSSPEYAIKLTEHFGGSVPLPETDRFAFFELANDWIAGRTLRLPDDGEVWTKATNALSDLSYKIRQQPWTLDDLAGREKWWKQKRTQLTWIERAADADCLYLPLPQKFGLGEDAWVDVGYSMSVIHAMEALQLSAMFALGNNDPTRAWQQIQRIDRMRTMFFKDRPMLVNYMICTARHDLVEHSVSQLLAHPNLRPELRAEIEKFLAPENVQTWEAPMLAAAVDGEHRFLLMKLLESIGPEPDEESEESEDLFAMMFGKDDEEETSLALDWRIFFREINRCFDERKAILAIADPVQCRTEFDRYIGQTRSRTAKEDAFISKTLGLVSRGYRSRRLASKLSANVDESWESPVEYRKTLNDRLGRLRLPAALSKWHAETGHRYPKSSDDWSIDGIPPLDGFLYEKVRDGFSLQMPDTDDWAALIVASPEKSVREIIDEHRASLERP